jgi:putative acetyltransferase
MESFRIREANESDVAAIRSVHRRSVLDLATKTYSPEVIANWKPNPSQDSFERHRESIRTGYEIVWVVEVSGTIEGFSVLVPSENELRALYVTGGIARRGIGTALFKILEEKAKELGLKKLKLSSSLNAQPFYEKNGFRALTKSFHTLQTGGKIECVLMEKDLSPEECA